jgi:hypothetical protein
MVPVQDPVPEPDLEPDPTSNRIKIQKIKNVRPIF